MGYVYFSRKERQESGSSWEVNDLQDGYKAKGLLVIHGNGNMCIVTKHAGFNSSSKETVTTMTTVTTMASASTCLAPSLHVV
ncbi:hypothetical protein PoB_004981400 [Plakobranchus ocellatus]|uniref:Profilin n=1 Tax=Plakobranchus ocellatus TaxID=259542 RepID=A0AAV4BY28_9GAST|nr:hypothetical protein PoB_004981400 [Plakobranchus ocellatus]